MNQQQQDLTGKTDQELEKYWNELAACFEGFRRSETDRRFIVGFFSLSKETERRGLEFGKDRFGKIILQPKKATA